MKVELPRHIFGKYSNIKFHENSFSESRVVPCELKDRQTYKQAGMRKLTVAFRNFSNAPKCGRSDCSHEYNVDRINVFWNCIRPPGPPETSLAATTQCRLQLCTVSRNSASNTLSTNYLSLPSFYNSEQTDDAFFILATTNFPTESITFLSAYDAQYSRWGGVVSVWDYYVNQERM